MKAFGVIAGVATASAAVAVAPVPAGDVGARRVIQCPLGAPVGVTAAAFSPNGRRLAYARPESTGAYSIAVSTLSGRIVARRAEGIDAPDAMAWAPRGSRLAYTSGSELHVVDAAGRLVFRAASSLELGGWLPDGSAVVVSAGTGLAAEAYVIDVATGVIVDLGPGAHAVPSPDGTRVAVAVAVPSPTDVYPGRSQHVQVVDLATRQRTTIFRAEAPVPALAWSPDSRRIAFLWDIDVEPDLMAQNADGSSTGLFGHEHGALPTQVGMTPPLRWTRRGIVGNALLEDGGSAVVFYDVVTGRARYRGITRYLAPIAAVAADGEKVAYIASAGDAAPRAGAAGLRVVGWAGTNDHAVLPCRGTGGSDRMTAAAAPTTILAGAGDDVVDARNRRRDVVDCGRGHDSALVDRRDLVRRCERVRRAQP
jgi:dipeptidyl aminopeptidase/acylaminoacyl peptidase